MLDIGLRKAQRGVAVGGTGVGKSTLCETVMTRFLSDYSNSLLLILDTKPRFRAADRLSGMSAKPLYKKWGHGPVIANSVVLDLSLKDGGLKSAYTLGYRIAIAQSGDEWDRPKILAIAAEFFKMARKGRPLLLYVDELSDFYSENGQPHAGSGRYRSILSRVARAGREMELSLLASMQRPVGIPRPIVQELTKLYLFRLDSEDDTRNIYKLSLPRKYVAPEKDHIFLLYDKTVRDGAYYKLAK